MGSAFVMLLVNLTKSHYEALMFLQAAKKKKKTNKYESLPDEHVSVGGDIWVRRDSVHEGRQPPHVHRELRQMRPYVGEVPLLR